MSSGWY